MSDSIHSSEHLNNLHHPLLPDSDDRYQGFSCDDPKFVERYVKGKLYVVVRFRIRSINKECVACFQRKLPICGEGCEGNLRDVDTPSLSNLLLHNPRSVRSNIEALKSGSDGEQQTVLVTIVKRMETPENIVSSLVRLYSPDDFFRFIPHAVYFGVKSGFLLIGNRLLVANWKRTASIVPSVSSDESAHQIIQCSPQILEYVPSDEWDVNGERLGADYIVDQAFRLRIVLSSDGIGAGLGVNEFPQEDIEIVDMLIGPLDL